MDQFLGTIMPVAFPFAPKGWALCNGQLLAISQYSALFALLGINFGGDGRTTFGLPNLQGRTPTGQPDRVGVMQGEEAVTLTVQNLPQHTHQWLATTAVSPGVPRIVSPADHIFAVPSSATSQFGMLGAPVGLSAANISAYGGSEAHSNMQPYLVVNYIIALQGIFPSRQ